MIELIETEAKSKAQQIREYVAAHPNDTPTEIAKAMKVNRQYIYTVMWKTKVNAGVKLKKAFPIKKLRKTTKKLGRPRKTVDLSAGLKFLEGRAQAKKEDWKQLGLFTSDTSIAKPDPVNHPSHYKVGGIETIDFIEAKKLNYNIGNVVKYLTRADHKGNKLEDLRKAQWYLTREINSLK